MTYVRQYDQNVVNSNSCSCDPYSSVYSHEQESCTDDEEDDLDDYESWPSSLWILIVRLRPQVCDGFWWISHVCDSVCSVGKGVVKTDLREIRYRSPSEESSQLSSVTVKINEYSGDQGMIG